VSPLFEAVFDDARRLGSTPALKRAGAKRPMLLRGSAEGGNPVRIIHRLSRPLPPVVNSSFEATKNRKLSPKTSFLGKFRHLPWPCIRSVYRAP